MNTNQKMALTGSGLVVAGIGIGAFGVALIAPGALAWGSRMFKRQSRGVSAKLEYASRNIGAVAGTLQRSLNAARKAGIAELKRSA